MRLNARELLAFGIKLLLVLILFALAWPHFAPSYNHFVATTAAWLIPRLTEASVVEVVSATADMIKLKLSFYPLPSLEVKMNFEYEGYFHFNLGLLVALLAATPFLRLSRILRLTLVGLASLVVFHILFLGISAGLVEPCLKGLWPCPQTWYKWVDRFMAVGKNLFPVVIWVLLTWRHWSARL
jgi:hypothetical protein